jgi:hypothetical protein
MKKLHACVVLLMILLATTYTNRLHAQSFLKNLVNNLKQNAQNRANDKATQTSNKAMDKIDSAMQIKSKKKSSSTNAGTVHGDSSATNRVLGAFAQAAQQNPNDSSSADVTMKALGILSGHGGVSSSDSAAAIQNFMSANGGSGYYYQYITAITSPKSGTKKDTTMEYFTTGGEGRNESKIPMPGASSNKIITISKMSQLQYSITLHPDTKTYALDIIDTSFINSGVGNETYQVTKIGNETVNGFSCIHARMVSNSNFGGFSSSSTFDIWTSTTVPGYAALQHFMNIAGIQPKMLQALQQAGCNGAFVKMTVQDKDYSMTMQLAKAGQKNMPSSMFQIPVGYTQSNENNIYSMIGTGK